MLIHQRETIRSVITFAIWFWCKMVIARASEHNYLSLALYKITGTPTTVAETKPTDARTQDTNHESPPEILESKKPNDAG